MSEQRKKNGTRLHSEKEKLYVRQVNTPSLNTPVGSDWTAASHWSIRLISSVPEELLVLSCRNSSQILLHFRRIWSLMTFINLNIIVFISADPDQLLSLIRLQF